MKGTHKKIPPTTNNLRETELRRRKFNKHHQPCNQPTTRNIFLFMWNPDVKASRHVESSERVSQISCGAVGWVHVDFGSPQFSSDDNFECQSSAENNFQVFEYFFGEFRDGAGSTTVNQTLVLIAIPQNVTATIVLHSRHVRQLKRSTRRTLNAEFLFVFNINKHWLAGKTRWRLQELGTRVELLGARWCHFPLSISRKCETFYFA